MILQCRGLRQTDAAEDDLIVSRERGELIGDVNPMEISIVAPIRPAEYHRVGQTMKVRRSKGWIYLEGLA